MVNSNNKIHHVDLHVGKRLKQKRIEKGISQDDLAGSVNLTFQQVQKYEKATNRISASKLYDFAKFLGIDVKYFFEGIDDYVTPEVKINYASDVNKNSFGINIKSKEIENLVEHYKKIQTAEVRKNILTLLKSLSS
ncbi:helix-turn-helix domain-containing protein [Candidatus Aquarickettsia rohweri]|uniref:XRE family transcriptional regulator n=1 Tax=Candidatus Aquarickettsia rohweri TaxID=2602574 RepID=A0A429XTX9_9RICK|nr:helix-turn-helix transcriptional regulator [Candidatus Aquarickettsia rohweri]MSO14114.1 putative transcriptional regulator in ATPase CF(0) region [Rickettsiales endosymbiont of Trichoplax sp. H2]RST71302.1 XRE family transcriptional regulator [Candidatus Aquarickettsia rohweri]